MSAVPSSTIPAELRPYVVEKVRLTGKVLGAGFHGSVEEAEIQGARCVAKKLHESLLPPAPTAEDRLTETFVAECRLMSTLRHPNIVQFLGVCLLPGSRLPVLLMERLMTDLHSLLETNSELPQAMKRSVLIDVAKGLLYLHSCYPPVIHGDLTARNVLLDSSMSAKIADLGTSRIVDIQQSKLVTMTKNPGNMWYMPPEVQEDHSHYTTAIDVFSFGILALFTLTQKFPDVKPATYLSEGLFPRVVGRSEIERRSESLDQISEDFGKQHLLVTLIECCLRNNYRKRPSVSAVLQRLESFSEDSDQSWKQNKLETMADIVKKDRQIDTLKEQTQAQQQLIKDMQTRIQDLQAESRAQKEANELMHTQIHLKLTEIDSLQKEKLHNRTKTGELLPIEKLPRTASVNVFEKQIMTGHRSIKVEQLQMQERIGTGQFGIVHKAFYTEKGSKKTAETVAVKTLKGLHVHDRSLIHKMMEESLKLRDFHHPNVLGLVGVCLDTGGAPYIIMPYMANGSLQQYLKNERQTLLLEEDTDNDELEDAKKRLTVMCLQIAQGMEYLTEQKFVHRDLASRNCMIDAHFVIKIADFGITEDIYAQNYFRQEKDASIKLPVKWMAPESLFDGMFSQKSDVWSYGVTCWEVFSGGKTPYPGVEPRALSRLLENGERLNRPDNAACLEHMYDVMKECWSFDPQDRPTFTALTTSVSTLISELAGYMQLSKADMPEAMPRDDRDKCSELQTESPPLPPDRRRQNTAPATYKRRKAVLLKHTASLSALSIRRRYKPTQKDIPEIVIESSANRNTASTM